MKTLEFKPSGESTVNSALLSAADEAVRSEVLIEVLPLIFHKLKNKLTPILGYTQILKARAGDEFSRERLERIERNTTELAESLNVLKDYGKRPRCSLRPASLGRLLEGMGAEWQGIADAAATRVVLELEPALPELPLDEGRLRVLLLDLAANAVQALRDKPAGEREIRLGLRAAEGALKLSLRDNGRGMAEEELAYLWTPFRAGFPGGSGLGLVLGEKVIADHGASCAVASVPGEFSEFTILFPLSGPPDAAGAGGTEKTETRSQRRTHEE